MGLFHCHVTCGSQSHNWTALIYRIISYSMCHRKDGGWPESKRRDSFGLGPHLIGEEENNFKIAIFAYAMLLTYYVPSCKTQSQVLYRTPFPSSHSSTEISIWLPQALHASQTTRQELSGFYYCRSDAKNKNAGGVLASFLCYNINFDHDPLTNF